MGDRAHMLLSDEPLEAVMRILEAQGLAAIGTRLINEDQYELRALGQFALKTAHARLAYMSGQLTHERPTETLKRFALGWLSMISWARKGRPESLYPEEVMAEMATVAGIADSAVSDAGLNGHVPSALIVRGDR